MSSLASFITRGSRLGRAQRGLFHGKSNFYGNNVAYSNKRVRRSWKPNVFGKSLTSELLNQKMKFKLTSTALRMIDKHGSLDNYLMYTKPHVLDSNVGERLKEIIIPKWEQKNGRAFDRRRELHLQKLKVLLDENKISQEEYDEEFTKSDPRMRRLYKIALSRAQAKLGTTAVPATAQN